MNIGCLFILLLGVLCLFAGYPIISYYTGNSLKTGGAYNLGGINGTGQVPLISNFPDLMGIVIGSWCSRTSLIRMEGLSLMEVSQPSASDSEHELSSHMDVC
jgi:hypothetical protein